MSGLQFNLCLKGYLRCLNSTKQRIVLYLEVFGLSGSCWLVFLIWCDCEEVEASNPAWLRYLSRSSVKPLTDCEDTNCPLTKRECKDCRDYFIDVPAAVMVCDYNLLRQRCLSTRKGPSSKHQKKQQHTPCFLLWHGFRDCEVLTLGSFIFPMKLSIMFLCYAFHITFLW